jgi:hypothetical protein
MLYKFVVSAKSSTNREFCCFYVCPFCGFGVLQIPEERTSGHFILSGEVYWDHSGEFGAIESMTSATAEHWRQ